MQTTSQKNAFGNGYGINRGADGDRALKTAVPPLAHVTVRPGRPSPGAVGKTGNKHFQGSKIYR